MLTLERQNDAIVEWTPMTRSTDNVYVNDATVTMTLKVTSTGTAVSGASSLTMTYVTDSNGRYQGRIPASALPVSLTLGAIYYLEATATAGVFTGYIKESVQLIERTL